MGIAAVAQGLLLTVEYPTWIIVETSVPESIQKSLSDPKSDVSDDFAAEALF